MNLPNINNFMKIKGKKNIQDNLRMLNNFIEL